MILSADKVLEFKQIRTGANDSLTEWRRRLPAGSESSQDENTAGWTSTREWREQVRGQACSICLLLCHLFPRGCPVLRLSRGTMSGKRMENSFNQCNADSEKQENQSSKKNVKLEPY